MSTPKPVVVVFKQKCPPYNPGEIAGFDPEIAQDFVTRGIADPYDAKKKPAVPPADA